MEEHDWDELAQHHAEVAALPGELRRSARRMAVPARQLVFRAGTRPSRVYCVLDGEVRLVRRSRDGAEVVLQRAARGFIAEASLDSPRYHCDAIAAAPTRLLGLPIDAFRESLRSDEKFRTFWMSRLARELRAVRMQCERLALHAAADRIEHYIESEGQDGRLQLHATRKSWAAELGLTHEALYRALARLRRAGRIGVIEKAGVLVLSMTRAQQASHPRTRASPETGGLQ